MQQPHKRLKFENEIPTVVSLLYLACTRIVLFTDYSDSKAAKIIVRHKTMSVRAKCTFPSSHQLQKSRRESFFCEWKCPGGLLTWLWSAGSTTLSYSTSQGLSPCLFATMSFPCFTTNDVLVLACLSLILCEVSVHVFVHIHVQAKNSNRTTVGTFSNFNLFCVAVACSFHFLRHYALLVWESCLLFTIINCSWQL